MPDTHYETPRGRLRGYLATPAGNGPCLCATRGFDVSAPNYGAVAKDRGFKGAAAKLERALVANGVEHDVKEYANAGHSFMTNQTGKWAFVARIPGLGHVEDAADDAWSRVFDFFGKHLAAK
ncbi:MAG TPA: dienelactone hydrolase family protein [Mycobacteriales bacterium]|nr:dienelactone hydrolase family protein [Mycobacteriales bacterium]